MAKKMPNTIREWFREQGSEGGKKSVAMFTDAERKARAKVAVKARWEAAAKAGWIKGKG